MDTNLEGHEQEFSTSDFLIKNGHRFSIDPKLAELYLYANSGQIDDETDHGLHILFGHSPLSSEATF